MIATTRFKVVTLNTDDLVEIEQVVVCVFHMLGNALTGDIDLTFSWPDKHQHLVVDLEQKGNDQRKVLKLLDGETRGIEPSELVLYLRSRVQSGIALHEGYIDRGEESEAPNWGFWVKLHITKK